MWVIVWTTVQTNNVKYVLKGILIQASGLKIVKTCTSQRSPCMLDSTNICNPSILWWSQLLEGRFTYLKKIQLFIPILALVQCSIWGLLSISGLRNALLRAACFTLLKLSNTFLIKSTNTALGKYSLLNTPVKNTKNEQFHTCFIVTIGQFNKYIYTWYQVALEKVT